MLQSFLALALALPAPAQDPAPEPPAKELVRTLADALEHAFAKGEAGERLRAIEAARDVPDEGLVSLIARGLKDEEVEVREVALEALRFSAHPRAVDELHRALEKAKPFDEKHDEARARLVLAIGQHASPSSLKLLARGSLDAVRKHTTQARIQALGRIRTREAVEELIGLMNKSGRGARGSASRFEGDLRLSLWALTGTDEGRAREDWQRWWNAHKRDPVLAEELAEEPRQLAVRWRRLWATPEEREAAEAGRGKRGGKRSGDGSPLD